MFIWQENVSLADILSLRDSCLNEEDIWAACLECCLSMKSISHTPLFHTLCITPDTLAFNANGNVCFMEQLSDDPEGAFVPPEFDETGNTFEAHIYSLGATLTAAAEYVIEPELEPDLSQELRNLLDQMQQEKPENRPDIESILSKCEEKTKCSSDIICRNLSAIGRRVLSIESVGALQVQTSERNPADGSSSSEDLAYDRSILNDGTTEAICRAENYDYDVDKNSTEVNEIFQQGLEYPSSAEIWDRKKKELGNDPEETVLDMKNNGSNVSRDLFAHELCTHKVPNHMYFCYFQQCFSLRELLSMDDKTLKDHELWSLCYESLCSEILQLLQYLPTTLNFALLICIFFSIETFDSFYLAPEFEKQSVVTEKVCVYGVAAILWTAAKFNAPANEKLSLSRSLKKLLLSMAKRNSAERPSVKEALKICNDYLVHRGIASRKILTLLRNSILQVILLISDLGSIVICVGLFSIKYQESCFTYSKLTAVKGPIPCQYSVNSKSPSKLPEAFTSPATHFKPIILTQHKEKTSNEDLKAKIKKFPGSEPSNDDFNGSVDTEDVASNSPLSNKCLFTQETLRTGIQAKTFTPIPHLTEISEDVHLSSSHILSCSLDAHMAIKSSSSNSICLLQKIVHLIQEEFAFDGYLENGEEAQAMGEYILSLNRLKFGTFTNAISEKFCDLYWDEKLLEQLYEVVNGDSPPLENLKERCNEEKEETEGHTTEVPEARLSVALWPTLSNMERKSCNPGWSSAFFGMECFNQDVKTYVKQLGQHSSSETQNIEAKMLELNQQLMMETKDFRKTKTFYQKLQQQERRSKGLKVLHMEQWGLNSSVLPSLVSSSSQTDMLELKSTDINSLLTFHSLKDDQSHSNIRLQMLQAGTTMGLMAYLYNSNAVIEGYIQQFFYTFRYFTSPSDLFQFLTDRFDSAAHIRSTDCIKVLNRTLDLLQGWVEECYNVDFAQDIELVHKLEIFISTKVNVNSVEIVDPFSAEDMKIEEDIQSLHSFSKKLSEENISRKSFKWKISKGSESTSPQHKERYYTIAAALPRPCYSSFAAELSGSCQKLDEKGLSMLTEYSPQHTAQQLTLLQQELFQDCHPVNFLNSRAFGVKDKSPAVTKSVSPEPVVIEGNSLFVPEYRQEHYLIQLIKYADNVGNWVSAEIVNCDTSKTQNGLITKCLLMAKCCYEWRNFATAMQILSGLENLIVRQLPAWKNLSSKALEIMEELTAVQVFLKSDSLCLMEGDSFRKQPTIPCACILAMHVQQVEIGSFTMANGTYKWPKLRKIAKVVSQIRAFQENPYVFTPDSEMQMYLRHRISHFSEVDIHVLAAENKTNFYQSSNELHSRKIQDTLRKVKATFQ
uniref:Protein very KIND n=1 Tax=Callorhinchus milii TaxID=7868 RepID=A0A4W3KC25_CALMI